MEIVNGLLGERIPRWIVTAAIALSSALIGGFFTDQWASYRHDSAVERLSVEIKAELLSIRRDTNLIPALRTSIDSNDARLGRIEAWIDDQR